ncbi:helix-turn-helix transcriptional regulator [Subtercola boreus]|nr:helix-turn-helix transcriptional regulator [Subtercola boreus]
MRDLIGLRKKHDLSQETVAGRMGVSQPTVAAFERYDSNPTLSSIRRYALAVGARIRHSVDDDCAEDDLLEFDADLGSSQHEESR